MLHTGEHLVWCLVLFLLHGLWLRNIGSSLQFIGCHMEDVFGSWLL